VPIESIGDWDVDLIAPDNLEDALVAAGKMRPEISLWRALQTQKLDEAELAERSRGPELSFMLMGAGGDRRDPMAKAGLVFSWAFEDGGARRAKAKKMLAEANAADHHALGAMMDAASETASAWASWKAAPSTVNAAERSVKASDEFYKIERVRFNAGKGTLSELLEAQEMLAESEALLASATWRQRLAWTNLMAAVGILNWDEINAEKELKSAFLSLSKEQVAP
jgi:outer membrane protein TolC